jgi:hypothetical protein
MQVTLFKALKSANVGDDEATAVVEQMALHVESVVNNNIRAVDSRIAGVEGRLAGVEARLTSVEAKLEAKIDALDSKMTFLMAIMALAVGLGPLLGKLIH